MQAMTPMGDITKADRVTLELDQEKVAGSPSFGTEETLSPARQRDIYDNYGYRSPPWTR